MMSNITLRARFIPCHGAEQSRMPNAAGAQLRLVADEDVDDVLPVHQWKLVRSSIKNRA